MIRPENLKIAAAGKQAVAGKVKRVTFFGSYYEITVLLAGDMLRVKTGTCQHKPGDAIYLGLAPDGMWAI
jgi:hypothetical protein